MELEAANQALSREVEEHKKTLAAARESESLWLAMTDMGPDAVFIMDGEGRFLYVNSVVARNFKMKAEKLIGRRESDILCRRK